MSIFKKAVVPSVKEISISDYYGNIDIDLLAVNDKIINRDDVEYSDFALICAEYSNRLLTKTQFGKYSVGVITNLSGTTVETRWSANTVLVPVLKFEKPLKELFKNSQKDDKGRDIVYFSKYPIAAVSKDEKENVAVFGNATNQKIHYLVQNGFYYVPYDYPIVLWDNEKYIKTNSHISDSNHTLRNGETIQYRKDYYLKIKPIKWLCDYENNRLVCLDGLVSGIPYFNRDEEVSFKKSIAYEFINKCLLPDLMRFVEVPKLEEVKKEVEIKDNILNMLRELLKDTEAINDVNDKILIVEDIKSLANLYGRELLKIKNKEVSIYGSTERELIRNGILPYYVYIEGEIKREIKEDNKEQENKEIKDVINKLKERASLINDVEIKNDILLQIEELNQDYLIELFKGKMPYQRIDFNKPLEEIKTNSGEVKLTFIPPRPVLIKELVEKELEISKRIDREINNNTFRSELLDFEEFANDIVKR